MITNTEIESFTKLVTLAVEEAMSTMSQEQIRSMSFDYASFVQDDQSLAA